MPYFRLVLLAVFLSSAVLAAEFFFLFFPLPGFLEDYGSGEQWDSTSVWEGHKTEETKKSEAYREATAELQKSNFEAAKEAIASCSEVACTSLLAEMYVSGTGVDRNLTEAMRLFSLAAEAGDPDAQYALAVLHSSMVEGDAVQLRRREALSVLYMYAASLEGHLGALMGMGHRHAMGYGVPKSCSTAALNYVEVAKRVAHVYSSGMPQAIELVRLGLDGGDKKSMTASHVHVFTEIALAGDPATATAVGKRYLIGTDGFRQDYHRAETFLRIAAEKTPEAMALLGYMHALGVGVEKNLDTAHSYFASAAEQSNPTGLNGLGYIHFHGAPRQKVNLNTAFRLFNESAYRGSADGMFNLASVYLTGKGVNQSFPKALLWYTEALDRGHTPAAYILAVMHLNGIGTMSNCKVAVDLFKRVCERSSWVSRNLQEAYDKKGSEPDRAAWLYLRLSEAGHEVAQANLAHLLDTGASELLFEPTDASLSAEELQARGKVHAQRPYKMAADQGNAGAELRLGDYAYYGWGMRMKSGHRGYDDAVVDVLKVSDEAELVAVPQEPDVELAASYYHHTASMKVTSEWMQPLVARASFNLGYLHQFGMGVPQDSALAMRHYRHSLEADPGGAQVPVTIMMFMLRLRGLCMDRPFALLWHSALADIRCHLLMFNLMTIAVLLGLRSYLVRQRARGRQRRRDVSVDHLHDD